MSSGINPNGVSDEDIERIAATGPQKEAMRDDSVRVHGKVYTRPLPQLRRKPPVTALIRQGRGFLTELSGKHQVQLDWHLNESAERDKVFRLTVDGQECYIDLEELTFYTRIMFHGKVK